MKGLKGIVLLHVIMFGFTACASISNDIKYANLAAEHEFSYFFPSPDFTYGFSTIDEAYDFVYTAGVKFSKSTGKSSEKGLAAKLTGPAIQADNSVFVVGYIRASSANRDIDLSNIDKSLETVLREAVSATLVFLVFYNDRAVSISDFHLADGWTYSSNSQIKVFGYRDNEYEAAYPIGWGREKAFRYLRGEIN
jgi:hypothetical protein